MIFAVISLLPMVCILIIASCLNRKGGYAELPIYVAALFLLWVSPQLILIAMGVHDLIPGFFIFIGMSMLCLFFVSIGWSYGKSSAKGLGNVYHYDLSKKRSFVAILVLTAISFGLNRLLDSLRNDYVDIAQWSGPITIVSFFAQIRVLALAISMIAYLRQKDRSYLLLFLVNISITLPFAILHLRRTEMIEIVTVLICVFWFETRKKISLIFLFPAALLMSLMVFSISKLRKRSDDLFSATGERLSIFNPQIWSNQSLFSSTKSSIEQAPDLLNAMHIMRFTSDTLGFKFGATLWNDIVFQYVPAQIVGSSVKESLMIGQRASVYKELYGAFQFEYQTGTTSTGIGTAYMDFWYIGAFVFFLVAAYMGRLYSRSIRGDFFAETIYVSSISLVLVSFTHRHSLFFVTLPLFFFVFGCMKIYLKGGIKIRF